MTEPGFRFPHPLILLLGCLALAAVLSHVLPAGRYQRTEDPATGRSVVVAGTYQRVHQQPLGPFQALVALPKGLVDAGSVVFLVFLVGGAFSVVEQTGALGRAIGWLAHRLDGRGALVIPVVSLAFALGGIAENMQEEIIAFVPVLLLLVRRLGFDPLTAVAMSLGSAAVGAAFSPMDPFQVGIAQKLAQLPPLSGGLFRTAFLVPAWVLWTGGVVRYALRTRTAPDVESVSAKGEVAGGRTGIIITLVLAAFALLIFGILQLGWGFDELSALFFAMGIVAGLIAGLGWSGTAEAFVAGCRSMAGAAMLIGFARAIYVALDQGQVLDTVVHGLFTPLSDLPIAASAIGMMAAHTILHIPVPSVSGQAVLTIPILVPVSDLLGMSRQVTVLAYHYGAGLCDVLTPTNGALMAILAAAGVPFGSWVKFTLPLLGLLFGLSALALVVAIVTGLR